MFHVTVKIVMDFSQIILISVISILTLLLIIVGFQFFLVLRDFRSSIRRANRIIDEIGLRTTTELLRVALGTTRGPFRKKSVSRDKKSVKELSFLSSVNEEIANGNGNGETEEKHEFEKPFGFALKTPPRFFRGIPKRR